VGHPPDGGAVVRIEDVGIEGLRSSGTEQFGAGPDPQEGPMSASTRTVQQTLGTRQLGAALVAIALVIVFAVALAISQMVATKAETAPAVRTAPVFIDHGSRSEIGPGAAIGAAPAYNDYGWKAYTDAAAAAGAKAASSTPTYNDYSWKGYTDAAAAAAAREASSAPVYNDHGLHSRLLRGSNGTGTGGSRLRPQ
jgi:hypothetical protein